MRPASKTKRTKRGHEVATAINSIEQQQADARELAATFTSECYPVDQSLTKKFQFLRQQIKEAVSDAEARRVRHEDSIVRLYCLCKKMSVVCNLMLDELRETRMAE